MNPVQQMQEVLEYLCRSLVHQPEDVQVSYTQEENNITFVVTCNPDDMGRLIGRSGKRASAIRTIVKAKAAQTELRVNVDFQG